MYQLNKIKKYNNNPSLNVIDNILIDLFNFFLFYLYLKFKLALNKWIVLNYAKLDFLFVI